MVAKLPNVRKLFIPDKGYTIFDADLSGADAQVVAWEANDDDLKRAFRAGLKIHAKNAEDVFGDEYRNAPGDRSNKGTPKGKMYDQNKRAVHATNYGASAFTLHRNPDIKWPLPKAEAFQRKWFNLHPGIKDWHQRTSHDLYASRTIRNKFGYRIIYFDRLDALLPQALAWVPQSTVAIVARKGALRLVAELPYAEILLQVHDSLVFQIPNHRADEHDKIREALSVPVPYPNDPLVIPWGLAKSSVSWGDVKDVATPRRVVKGAVSGLGIAPLTPRTRTESGHRKCLDTTRTG